MTLVETTQVATADAPGPLRRWFRRWQFEITWMGVAAFIGVMQSLYQYLGILTAGGTTPFLEPFIRENTSALAAGALYLGVSKIAARWPLARRNVWQRFPLYLVAMLVFSGLHTSLNWLLRSLLYQWVGLGAYDYGKMPLRYLMELPMDVIWFWVVVTIFLGLKRLEQARQEEVRSARLEGHLARAELRNLRLQLQPHFLFNSLHTISATMYENLSAADELIDRLAELLRASLETVKSDEISLSHEVATLRCYISLMEARFGERLDVQLDIASDTGEALVPSMILQPLVENAIQHSAEKVGRGWVRVSSELRGGRLLLEVVDDGAGCAADRRPLESGVGLSSIAERLEVLYGADHRLEAANRTEGGFRVAIEIPT